MHSLRTKILVLTFVFLALAYTSYAIFSLATISRYRELRIENIKIKARLATKRVNKTIIELERGAIDLALNALLYYKSQSHDIGVTSVLEYVRGFTTCLGGGIWFEPYAFNKNTYRTCIYAFLDKDKGKVRLDYIDDKYDYHNQSWYREIIDQITASHQVVWTKPYIDDTSYSLMTTAGAGVFNHSGELIGISNIDWEIDEAVTYLTEVKPTECSFVILSVPEKDFIISSIMPNNIEHSSLKTMPWDINADSFKLNGIKYLQFSQPMDNGWLLSMQIPEKEIFAEVNKYSFRFFIRIVGMAIINLTLIYFLVSKLINTPIKHLIHDVSQLALGNLDIKIDINSKDELGLLAQTFNKMATNLKESIETNIRECSISERIHTELSIATQIQTSMLPYVFPPFPDRTEFDIYASMFPVKEIGGDFYDFHLLDKDNLVIVIADVSGKGVPAALFMVITKTLMQATCSTSRSPKTVFEIVNNKLCESNEASMFVTAFIGFYNIPTGRFVYTNAGHNPPLVKKHNGNYEFIKTKPCVVLAWMENIEYTEEEIILEPGDTIFLYTDGVTEAMNTNKDLFTDSRLLKALNKHKNYSPEKLLSAIKLEVNNFADGAEQADDIAMLALRVNEMQNTSTNKDIMKKIEVKAEVESLDKVLDFINIELDEHNCPADSRNNISVAVEEIFMNISNYAYEPEKGNAIVGILIEEKDKKAIIKMEDMGKPYNPLEQTTDPNLDMPLIERDVGGLGVFLVKKLMDTVEYMRIENKNVFTMTKKLS